MNKSQIKLIAKITEMGYVAPKSPEVRTNPYSGASRVLEPLACQLYDFVTTRHHVCGRDYTRAEWDRARYLFAEKWPPQYMDLLD